jgi:hypothetical protein
MEIKSHKVKKCSTGVIIVLAIFWGFSGCATQILQTPSGVIRDGRYDLAFPFGENADAIKIMLESIKLVNATAYYESYVFPFTDQITKPLISKDFLENGTYTKTVFNDYSVGTATIIYFYRNRVAVLTCAHVVNFADTIYTYYSDGHGNETPYLYRIAIKKQQRNFIADLRQGEDFEIIAIDNDIDVAVLGKKLLFASNDIPVFAYKLGRAQELEWGNLLYLAGYPSGKKMLTTGIVSSPNRNYRHDFLVDALFNRGFSGGIALAIRDGYPNFELVGIVNAVAAEEEIVLVPGEFSKSTDVPLNTPYSGNIFATTRKKINYGISFGISIETIIDFLNRNEARMANKGYILSNFFKKIPVNN